MTGALRQTAAGPGLYAAGQGERGSWCPGRCLDEAVRGLVEAIGWLFDTKSVVEWKQI